MKGREALIDKHGMDGLKTAYARNIPRLATIEQIGISDGEVSKRLPERPLQLTLKSSDLGENENVMREVVRMRDSLQSLYGTVLNNSGPLSSITVPVQTFQPPSELIRDASASIYNFLPGAIQAVLLFAAGIALILSGLFRKTPQAA